MQAVMAVFMQIYPRAKCLSMLLRARVWFLCVCVLRFLWSPPACLLPVPLCVMRLLQIDGEGERDGVDGDLFFSLLFALR